MDIWLRQPHHNVSLCQASKLRLVFLSSPDVLLRLRYVSVAWSRHRSRRSWWLGLTRRTQHGGRDTVTPIIITTQNITLSALSLLIIPFKDRTILFRMIILSTNVQMHLCMDDIFCQAIDSNEEIWTGMSLKSQPSDRISSRNAYFGFCFRYDMRAS